jgi:ribonuclease R
MKRRRKGPAPVTEDSLLRVLSSARRPVGIDELEKIFSREGTKRRELMKMIDALIAKGRVIELKNKRFGLTKEMNLVSGTLWCTRSGNGFVIPDKEGKRDVFVSSRNFNNAVHGDRVAVRLDHYYRGKPEGKIIRVISRKSSTIIGFTKTYDNILYIIPEDYRYNTEYRVSNQDKNLPDGQLAVARITAFPGDKPVPECRITSIIGELDSLSTITKFIEYKHTLPRRFPRNVEEAAAGIASDISPDHRKDLRDLAFVTIDGQNARDFDDAIAIERTSRGFTLHVAIADVSHYVGQGSPLDEEAYKRGTSIYFPDRVLPMLPKALSNGICSLNPREDRYTVTATIMFDREGRVTESSFFPSVIRSRMRLTYESVEMATVHSDLKTRRKLKDSLSHLEDMAELAGLITCIREKRGSIDFDLPEPQVILDIEGGISRIVRAERLNSHRIIEEFMVSANEAVARFLEDRGLPALFRVHEPPEQEKLRDFERLLQGLGIRYKKLGTPGALQDVLSSVCGTQYEFIVNRVLLRSMKQARYSANNRGHFGLASESYLHFTSPIRRYPDLVCHRVLKNALAGRKEPVYTEEELITMANHASERERLVMDAERELEERIRILYMKDKLGETIEGVISHVTSFGFFVELTGIFVEGLVPLSSLIDDYYHFEEERYRIIGTRTRKAYRIGDILTIKVALADVTSSRLHFEVCAP